MPGSGKGSSIHEFTRQYCDFLSQDIVYGQSDMAALGDIKPDRRARIEGIGEILVKAKTCGPVRRVITHARHKIQTAYAACICPGVQEFRGGLVGKTQYRQAR